jgi:hypothetical protein
MEPGGDSEPWRMGSELVVHRILLWKNPVGKPLFFLGLKRRVAGSREQQSMERW